jgi:hypothetical protein
MIGSSQGGQPTAPRGSGVGRFDNTYGYGSQSAWQAAGAPKGGQPGPGANSQAISSQSSIRPPKYISQDATDSSVNNTLAMGYQNADQRFQMKQMDRAGVSRGKGAQYIAGQMGTQEMGKAASEAAQTRAQDQMQNAQMKSDYERAREMEAQSLAMTGHSFDQADWNRWFAQQQSAAQLMQALMSGAQGMATTFAQRR